MVGGHHGTAGRERAIRALIVRCAGPGRHRVRLSRSRFWARARCPHCRAPVDPLRWRRVVRALGFLVRPPGNGRTGLVTWAGSWAYLVAAVAAWALLWGFADRWWPATVLLFGPRWTLLLPLGVLLPLALRFDRVALVMLAPAVLIVVGPVMGLAVPWSRWLGIGPLDSVPELAVVTFNARGGEGLALSAAGMLREWRADIAAFQECTGTLRDELLALDRSDPAWHTDARTSLCIASRYPIVARAQMERDDFAAAGGSALVVTWSLLVDVADTVHVTNLHLETPRAGLASIRQGRIAAGARDVSSLSFLRALELAHARRWVLGFRGPHLVLGDFNTPPESVAYREAWGDFQNVFSDRGFGLGGTRLNGWIRARIDHVLADARWRPVSAAPGRDLGSDHLPMRAVVQPFWPSLGRRDPTP